jgi:hypothetical protein
MRLLPIVLLAAACGPQFPSPMTAGQMMQFDTGDALVAYLRQPDASTTACDLRAKGPHITGYSPDVRDALVDGFSDGKLPPDVFQGCAEAAFKSAPADQQVALLDAVVDAYAHLVDNSHLADDPPRAARLAVAARLYLDRRSGLDADPTVVAPIVDKLRDKLTNKKLSQIGAASARELVASADIERGVWQGQPVTAAVLDALAADGNEMALARFAARLPQPELREQAARRIVRVHITLSAFDEVRGNAAAVEDAVVKDGHNRVTVADHPLVRAWYDATTVPVRGVVVRQNVWNQTATLLGVAPARPTVSVLPALTLRRNLWAELQQVSRPVTVCSPKRELDPTPCIEKTEVSVDNPFAYLDKGATFHFRDDIAESDIVPWAAQSEFALPIAISKQPSVTVHWGLSFERPEALDFSGPIGSRGPDLDVHVTLSGANRYVFDVNGKSAVVEAADLPSFHVASRGGAGETGTSGTDGSTGSSGSECSDGGPGGSGGNGGDGGGGGDGGDVRLTIACGGRACDIATIERVVFSAGGIGGSGGAGGRGGAGGSGGSGRSARTHTDENGNTITDDPGCSAGSSGPSGSDGASGADGMPGNAGHVSVVVEH